MKIVRNIIHALIAVLMGMVVGSLLVGSIVRIREAAAHIQCNNNLRQLGLAMRNYQDSKRGFPLAGMANPDLRPEERLSWIVEINPYIQADNLYSKMDKKKSWDAEENRFAALMRHNCLQCPAYRQRLPVGVFAPSHYLGISGIGADAIELPEDDPRAGLFGYTRSVTPSAMQGGTGMLIGVMETSEASGSWTAAGPPTVRGLDPSGPSYLGVGGQFGGMHRGGVNVLRADGSVRFLNESVYPEVLEALVKLKGDHKAWPDGDE
jgi:prepilin-type processing-associated H-X9-DG protein